MKTSTAIERRIAEEVEAERLASRQAFVDEIAEIRTTAAPKIAAAVKNEAATERVFNDAKADLEKAEDNYRVAQCTLAGLKAERSGRIRRLESHLRNSATERIDDFIAELRREHEQLCADGSAPHEMRRTATGSKQIWSRSMSLSRRLEALTAAANQAELLKLEPLNDGELSERFEALRAGLPEVRLELFKADGKN